MISPDKIKEVQEDKRSKEEGSNSKGNTSRNTRSGKPRGNRNRGKSNRNKSTNDPAWYSNSPELLRDSASIPFSWPVGTPLRTSQKVVNDTVPGVCGLYLKPAIGNSLNENSAANVASSAIYSWVRHANSGARNYDAPDLMMYLLAMANVYSFINWMQRIYGYLTLYDQRNRYLPRAIAAIDHVDFDDFRNNLANFRYFLNEYITKVASLAVPATMSVFPRLAMLYSNIYSEGPSIKDQMYMYAPYGPGWYHFQINSGTGAGELAYVMIQYTGAIKLSDLISYADSMFNAIWQQEDFGIMSGDILKAYEGNVIKLQMVPEVVGITPIYDPLVLHQFKNAKIVPALNISRITQDPTTGIISQSITINPSASATHKAVALALGSMEKVLSTDFDAPGPDVVIESTRLMPAYDSYKGVFETGTEVPLNSGYAYFDNSGVLRLELEDGTQHLFFDSTGGDATWTAKLLLCEGIISNFKYHPEVMRISIDSDNAVVNMYRNFDIDNYAVLNNETLVKMHGTALMSMFAVPAIAKIS